MRLRGVYENLFGDFPIGSGSETAPLIFSASLGATVIRDFQFPTWAEGRPGLSLRTGPGRFGDPVTLSPARDCCPTLAARSLAVDRARALRRPVTLFQARAGPRPGNGSPCGDFPLDLGKYAMSFLECICTRCPLKLEFKLLSIARGGVVLCSWLPSGVAHESTVCQFSAAFREVSL